MECVRTVIAVVILFIARSSAAEDILDEKPRMLSTPSNLNVLQGSSVLLPCNVAYIDDIVRIWKKMPSQTLFSGTISVFKDPKVSLEEDGSSLHIQAVTPDYAGEYVCQVSNHPLLRVVHRIQVLVPPAVKPAPADGEVVVRKGESASMRCDAKGIPKPLVTWTFQHGNGRDSSLPGGVRQVQGSQLNLTSVDVQHGGLYRCTADNDVGETATATFNLTVLYSPEVLVKPEWAHGDEGATVEFVCTCKSAPHSHVTWLHGSNPNGSPLVHSSDHVKLKERVVAPSTIELKLKLQRLRKSDLGAYTCLAKNSVGDAWKTVEISGLAEPVQLRGTPSGDDSFLLLWKAKSYSPIIEYQLKIRKHKSGDTWTDVSIPVAEDQMQQSLLYSQSYNITGLEPGHRYEAVLQAHNDFGWNRPSETFFFHAGPIPESENEDIEPSLLPLHNFKPDVTDPTYSKQEAAAASYARSSFILPVVVIILIFL